MDLVAQALDGIETVSADPALKKQARAYLLQWLTQPEFTPYRPQLEWLIQEKQWAGLLDRFYQILPFGTGGRRGAVGIGPNRMNRWTLGASVQGHCEYLKERFPGVEPLRVVLAYDVRQFEDQRKSYNPNLPNPVLHVSSKDLAQYAAGVYVANGIHVAILPPDSPRYLATPELSWTIRLLNAHGGLNLSASHNPPDDNGGKFYDERGGQPVPPDDQIMADLVDQVRTIKEMAWSETLRTGKVMLLDDRPHATYIEVCRKQSLIPPPTAADDFKVVFTPLHGVGSMTAMEVLQAQGFRVIPVESQMKPDGQFRNVTMSPNPEVPQSMDRAVVVAQEHGADLVLATDPDADRLGAMIPVGREAWGVGRGEEQFTPHAPRLTPHDYRPLTGNEIASLLTHFKLSKLSQQNRLPRSPIVIRTEVTTSQVTRIARHFKAQVVDNLLVGFKYMAEVLWQLEQNGSYEDVVGSPEDFVIASEESFGILPTHEIRDKDAGSAALLLAELALDQKRKNRTVLDYLDALAREFGYFRHVGVPVYMTGLSGKQQMAEMLDKLRAQSPGEIGGMKVQAFEDLRQEPGRFGPIKGATDFAARNVLLFHLEETSPQREQGISGKVALRPSGTEPKAKIYVEVFSDPCPPAASPEQWQQTCRKVDELLERISQDFVKHSLSLIGLAPKDEG